MSAEIAWFDEADRLHDASFDAQEHADALVAASARLMDAVGFGTADDPRECCRMIAENSRQVETLLAAGERAWAEAEDAERLARHADRVAVFQ